MTDGREVRKSNPLKQAKQYAFGVCRLLESDPALVGEPGTSFQGKLAFPLGLWGGACEYLPQGVRGDGSRQRDSARACYLPWISSRSSSP